jgi:hypothetical protein
MSGKNQRYLKTQGVTKSRMFFAGGVNFGVKNDISKALLGDLCFQKWKILY